MALVRPKGSGLVLALATAAAYAATLVIVASPAGAALAVLSHAPLAAPGVLALWAVAPGNWLAAAAFGPMLGFGLSSTAMLGYWALGARGAWLLAAAPMTAALLAWPLRRLRDRWSLPSPARGDLAALMVVLLLVPLVVARPFSRVGEQRPEGKAYRAYFTADYVWRRAVVIEVSKGEFLPRNPYYVNDSLHYYWVGHLPDAVEYRAVRDRIDLDRLLLGSSVVIDAAFVAAVYGLARLAAPVPWSAAAGVAWVCLLSSFEGTAGLWEHWRKGAPVTLLRYFNVDAVARWLYGGMPIDGLHRILWYQPHHATAYALGAIGLFAVVRRRRIQDPEVFFTAGVILGVTALISTFVTVMFLAAVALVELVTTLRHRAWWTVVVNAAWAALPVSVAAAIATALQYVDNQPGGLGVIRLGINSLAVTRPVLSTFVSAGPVLLVAAGGAWAAWRQRRKDVLPFAALVLTSVAIYFYVDVRDHQDVYVGWRVGHVVFIALVPIVALALADLRRQTGVRAALGWTGVAVVGLFAAPMFLIDAFNTQDVTNQEPGPGFRWTMVLTPPEVEGLEWIRTHTGQDARVQVDPYSRDSTTWAFVPAFAERRMGVGLPLGLVPLEKYLEGSKRARWLFEAPDPAGAFALAERVGIDYLVVGPPERRDHPGVEDRYAQMGAVLPLVFKNDALAIYEVKRPGHVR
ncbi:MAG: hypothetical protein R2745_23225 [Vicinamibacterales bacterium]